MRRRSLLVLGAATATVLVVVGGSLAWMKPGLSDGRLGAAGRRVFAAVGRAILEGTLPADPQAKASALAGLLVRIDLLARGLPLHAQKELSQLLALLDSPAGRRAIAGLFTDWNHADTAAIQQALQSMRTSSLRLRQQAYHALHDIVGGAYFADASTWPQLGYPGPMKI